MLQLSAYAASDSGVNGYAALAAWADRGYVAKAKSAGARQHAIAERSLAGVRCLLGAVLQIAFVVRAALARVVRSCIAGGRSYAASAEYTRESTDRRLPVCKKFAVVGAICRLKG